MYVYIYIYIYIYTHISMLQPRRLRGTTSTRAIRNFTRAPRHPITIHPVL